MLTPLIRYSPNQPGILYEIGCSIEYPGRRISLPLPGYEHQQLSIHHIEVLKSHFGNSYPVRSQFLENTLYY